MSKPAPQFPGQRSPGPDAVLPFALPGQPLWLAIYTTRGGDALNSIDIVPAPTVSQAPSNALAETVVRQLEAYLRDPQRPFDLPLQMQGTEFQQRLWSALRAVPAGTTQTYGQLAQALRSGAQAVGQACRRNPVPIVVPCHRILAQSGIGGYAGAVAGEKLGTKRALLAHEGVVCG